MVFDYWGKKRRALAEDQDIKTWKVEFLELLEKLKELDLVRLQHAKEVSEAGKNKDNLITAIGELKATTDDSSIQLENFKDSLVSLKRIFENHLASLNKENRSEPLLENVWILIGRYFSMVRQIKKYRKKETARLEYLVKNLHRLTEFGGTWRMRRAMRKIHLDLKDEEKTLLRICSYHQYDLEIVGEIRKYLLKEKAREVTTTVVAGAAWLAPGFGTALNITILALSDYAGELLTTSTQMLDAYII